MKNNSFIKIILFASLTIGAAYAQVFSEAPLSADQKLDLIHHGFWNKRCPMPLERLSYLTMSYYDFDNQEKIGNLIVYDAVSPFLLNAFKEFYKKHFPIEYPVGIPVDNAKSSTMSFDCREITGEQHFYSLHSFGLAIDINISRNPYLGHFISDRNGIYGQLVPMTLNSFSYLDRANIRPGMNEEIFPIMKKAGFIGWGGRWHDRLDYMHFEFPPNIVIQFSYLDRQSAEKMIKLIIKYPTAAEKMFLNDKWKKLYIEHKEKYMDVLSEYFQLLEDHSEQEVIGLVREKLSGY